MRKERTLLVVDDSAFNRALLRRIFKGKYALLEAGNGLEALDLLRRQGGDISAVLLDVFMPVMDGFNVLREMRKSEALSKIPVVVVTAQEDAENEIRALKLGATDFVAKPFVPEVIHRRVDNAVEKRALEESLSAKIVRELSFRANYDSLTGIYNKDNFYRATRELLDRSPEVPHVLIRWNVERFKLINDLFGKELGDQVLREIAAVLKRNLSGTGTYGRLEADHFAACLPVRLLDLDRLAAAFTARFAGMGVSYTVILDAGLYEVEDPALPVDQMCDRANLALQTVNGKYHRRYAYYNDEMRAAMLREQSVRGEMSEALRQRQFQVYLQPICSLSTGRPIGAEALVRWIHPERGLISPGDFIPLFEKSGFISELDHYVWEEACRYLQQRAQRGLEPLPVSVNASRTSLYNASFHEEIIALTRRYSVDPALFKIEITETAYSDNPEQLLETTQRLQEAGYSILMDDFGSGYSSLNTLKDIPVDTLKIDMKFLQGFEQGGRVGTVLLSVLRMAKWLNLPVVAEGVETAEQVAFLRSVGCDWIQGYCFAKPMPFQEFEDYVSSVHTLPGKQESAGFDYQDFDLLMGGNQLINRLMEGMFGGFGLYEYSRGRMEVIRVNDGYYDILGSSPADLQKAARNAWERLHPDDVPKAEAACRESIRTGQAVRVTLRRFHRDGHVLSLECIFRQLGGSESSALFCIAFNDITASLEAERTAREEQERYRLISENSGTIVLEWDLRRSAFRSDPGYEFFTLSGCGEGDTPEEVQARLEQVHPDDRELFLAYQVPDRDTDYKAAELRLMTRDGTWHWCRLTKNCVRDDEGRVVRILGTINDINRQRRSEQALVNKEAQLRGVEENLSGAIGVFELRDGLLLLQSFSDGLCRITGYTKEAAAELYRRPGYPGVHPDDRPGLIAEVRRCVSQELTVSHSYRLICKDGTFSWVNLTASPIRVDGELKYYGVFTDIEEQHSATAQLEAIMANVDAGIVLFEDGEAARQLYANEKFFRMAGLDREAFAREGRSYFDLLSEEYRSLVRQGLRTLVQEGRMPPLEYPLIREDGSTLWLSHRASLMTTLGSVRPVILSILTDITERRENARRGELHRYAGALFGVYDEIFAVNYANNTSTMLASRYREATGEAAQADAAIRHWVEEAVVPEQREQVRAFFDRRRAAPEEPARRMEYQAMWQGKRVWVSTTVLHVEDGDYLVCNMDVSRRREAELLVEENAALRAEQQEQERYRIIVERAGAMVLEWDLERRTFYASESYGKLASSAEEPFALLARFPAPDGPADTDAKDLCLRRTDGSAGWYRITRTDVADRQGRLLRVIATIADIDAEKRASLALEEALARLQTLIDTIPAGLSCYEADQAACAIRPVLFSVGRARMLGYTQEELMERGDQDAFALVHEEDRPQVMEAFHHTIRTGAPLDCTYRQVCRDGRPRWVRVSCGTVPAEPGRLTLYCVYTDMEALMETQQELLYRDQVAQLLLSDSDTITADYQRGQDLLTVNYSAGGARTTARIPRYLASARCDSHIHPDDCVKVRSALERLLAQGCEEGFDFRGDFSGQGWRWYHCSLAAVTGEQGRVDRVIGKAWDIMEDRKAEYRYREELAFGKTLGADLLSTYRLNLTRQILEAGHVCGASQVHTEGSFVDDEVFRAFCDAPSLDQEARTACWENFQPSRLMENYNRGVDTAQTDYLIHRPDGRRHWVRTLARVVKKPDSGELVAFFTTWDIHDRKVAQAMVQTVVDLDYDFLMYIDSRDGSFQLFPNERRLTRCFRRSSGDYELQRMRDMRQYIHEEDRERWARDLALERICQELEAQPRYSVCFRVLEEDGRAAWKSVTFAWLDRARDALLSACTDVTEQVSQEQERSAALRRALREAERASAEKDRFLSRTSHEIRTPMNAIIGLSGLALGEAGASGALADHLRKIQYAGEYMLALVNDILDVSRIESGSIELHPAPCLLRDYVAQMETLARPAMEEKGIDFQVDAGPVLDRVVRMDKVRVLQVFTNLLTNATRFTPPGGHIRCTLESLRDLEDGFLLRTTVQDDGIGMSPAFMEHMYEPFERESPARGGAGLGLTIVRRLVEAMDGAISARSEARKGTVFTVDLPLRNSGEEGGEASAGLTVLTDDFTFAGRRILVAEDQPINAEVARKLLEKKRFSVEVVTDGAQAAEAFASHEPGWYSAVLMDIRMPVLDGLEATRRIRRMDRSDARSLPIVAMTGNVFDDDVRKSLAAGLDAHLEKPIQPRQLYQTLAALIFARENERKLREPEHRVRQQEKIYKLLLSQSNSRVFEYDVAKDALTLSGGSAHDRGAVIPALHRAMSCCATIAPSCRDQVLEVFDRGIREGGDDELLFQADFDGGGYRWYNAYCKCILGPDGRTERIVGRLDDVDEKTKRTLALRARAEYDAVTGLYNRATFQELVQNDLAGRDPQVDGVAAFVEFDLDDFKAVNDTFGHPMGDELLRSVAQAVRAHCRQEDLVGRLGGDEFAVWMNDVGNAGNVMEKMRLLGQAIQEASRRLNLDRTVTASFGVAMVTPHDREFSALFHRADVAMYQAKRQGKDGCAVYTGEEP